MRNLLLILFLVTCLPGCTLLMPEKTPVSGSVWLVSQAEIHRAIAAARAVDANLVNAPIELVTVYSRTELVIYFRGREGSTYGLLRRENGRWRYLYGDPIGNTVVT